MKITTLISSLETIAQMSKIVNVYGYVVELYNTRLKFPFHYPMTLYFLYRIQCDILAKSLIKNNCTSKAQFLSKKLYLI